MRVGLAVDALSPRLTGIGRYTWEICQGLMSSDIVSDLGLFRYDSWINDPELYLVPPQERPILSRIRPPRAIRRWRAKSNFRGRIFHGPNFFLPLRAELGVITVHDLSVLRFPDTHPVGRVRSFEKFFLRSLGQAAHIVTDSETVRNEIIADHGVHPSKVSAVHLGIGRHFQNQSPCEISVTLERYGLTLGGYILSVATFEPRKRIDKTILAHAELCDRRKINIPLVLVGASGWHNDDLHALIEKERAKGRLSFLGFVPEQDLPAIYAGASLFVYPSIYEGFGLPPVEAMAAGVPTIVSRFSCMPEITGGIAQQVDPDDIDGFSRAIERCLEDAPWRTTASGAGRAWVQQYTWGKCLEGTIEVYKRALSS